MIRWIFWDLGNVLTAFDERMKVIAGIVKYGGGDPSGLASFFPDEAGEARYDMLDTGRITHEELWRGVCAGTGIDLSLELFSALYVAHLQPIIPMVEFAKDLQEHFRTGVVSNGDFGSTYIAANLQARHGLEFERVFVSYEERLKKPNLFRRVDEFLVSKQVRPHECLYVDDIPRYAEAARAIGMRAIVHDARTESVNNFAIKLLEFGVEL